MTFLNDEDRAARRQAAKPPAFSRDQIISRSRTKAAKELSRLVEEARSHYRLGGPVVTFVFNENPDEYDAEILARELARLIEEETGFATALNPEHGSARSSITVSFEPQPARHDEHGHAGKTAWQPTPRLIRWVIVPLMAITAIVLILLGMSAGFKGQDKDGEILVFSGGGMVIILIVTCVLLFANDDSNHQDR
jgi:hypothetical protein